MNIPDTNDDGLPRLYTVEELARYFGTKGTHYVERNRAKWPHVRIATETFFEAADVRAILDAHRNGDTSSVPAPAASGRVTRGGRR